MKLRQPIVIAAVLPLLLLLTPRPGAAQTGFTVTLIPSAVRVVTPMNGAQVFTFTGTLTNNTGTALFLNADNFSLDFPMTLDDTAFQNTFVFPTDTGGSLLPQPSLAAHSSETTALFSVTVPAGTSAGTYGGTFEIQGGAGTSDFGLLAAPAFTVNAAPVPEASTAVSLGLLSALGLAGCLVSVRRKKTPPSR